MAVEGKKIDDHPVLMEKRPVSKVRRGTGKLQRVIRWLDVCDCESAVLSHKGTMR